jgi:hypothetical protein
MAAALTKLKGFIQTYSGLIFTNISEIELDELKIFITQAISTIRWEIEDEISQMKDHSAKSIYILALQFQLTYLADGITGFQHDDNNLLIASGLFDWLSVSIYELLEHIREYFSDYFDFDAELPIHFFERYQSSIPLFGDAFSERLTSLNVDPKLSALILGFSQATNKTEQFKIRTWRQWDYLAKTVRVISQFLENPPKEDIDLELLKLMICKEFNSVQVYAYFLKYIERITLSDAEFHEQQQDLIYLLKIFQQVRVDAQHLYDPKVQSLKLSVIESLEAELAYLEQKEKLYTQNFKITSPNEPSKFYFVVAVTLAELMFFFRILLEVAFIQTKFKSYLYEFVNNHIKTERAENISKKSQRNHFSNKPFPDRIVQSIRSWLQKMINHIDQHYKL